MILWSCGFAAVEIEGNVVFIGGGEMGVFESVAMLAIVALVVFVARLVVR